MTVSAEQLQAITTAAQSNPLYASVQQALVLAQAQLHGVPDFRVCNSPEEAREVIKQLALDKRLLMGAPQSYDGHKLIVWFWNPKGK